MRISDWSSDVCSSDLQGSLGPRGGHVAPRRHQEDPSGSHGRDCQGNGMSEDSKSPLKVWGWSADKGGCQAYRIRFPLTAIKEYRPDVVIGWGGVIPEAARVAADVIVGQRAEARRGGEGS